MFIGSHRTISTALEKIIDIEAYADAIEVHREGKEKVEVYQWAPGMQMAYQFGGKTLSTPITGVLVKYAIDQAIAVRKDPMARAAMLESDGDALKEEGKFPEALKSYRDSLATRERLLDADPSNIRLQLDTCMAYARISTRLGAQSRLAEARIFSHKGSVLLHRLVKDEPSNATVRELRKIYDFFEPFLEAANANSTGQALLGEGKLLDALKFHRNALDILERLASLNSNDLNVRRQLLLCYDYIGDVLEAQGNFEAAMDSYQHSFQIREEIVRADPQNTGLQRDLLVSYEKVGRVLMEQRKLDEALKFCQNSLALAESLAKATPESVEAHRDVFAACEGLGDVLVAQSHLDEGLIQYQNGLSLADLLAKSDPGNQQRQVDYRIAVGKIGGTAFKFILNRNFSRALELADQAISSAPDQIWVYANRACALMFLGRVDEARTVYLRYRGQKVREEKSWEAVVLQDFAELRKLGLTHPLMDEVEGLLSPSSEVVSNEVQE